jgi:twinkle protein
MRETHGRYEILKPREDTKIKIKKETLDGIEDSHYDWLSSRGISATTAQKYDLVAMDAYGHRVLGFPYFDKEGNVVAVKQRLTSEKKFYCEGTPSTFFGLRHIQKGDDLYIVEGEMDVLAFAEIGVKAVSVPNGAPMKVSEGRIDPQEDPKFRFLWDAKEYIDAAKRIFIATDTDGPGEALAEEIARRVGKSKCWRIKFPEGIKDGNDCLVKCGKEAFKRSTQEAEPWPIQGLYDAQHFRDLVRELYDKGAGKGESTGYSSVDDLYTVVPGQVTIVTGIPSSGKSEFIDQIMVNLAQNKSWKFGICSFENEPRLHIAKLMAKRAGLPFFEGYHRRMSKEEYDAAFDFINNHFTFVWQDDGSLADLDSILDRLRSAILRHGIRGAIIDPYNFISRDSRDKSETEWISDMLTKVKAFAMGHGVHIWFVAHPTKMQRGADGKIPPPGGFDISGSAAWFAKADCGLTVHREKENPHVAQIHIWKCRFSWVGKQGQTNLVYDIGTTRYNETLNLEEEDFPL